MIPFKNATFLNDPLSDRLRLRYFPCASCADTVIVRKFQNWSAELYYVDGLDNEGLEHNRDLVA